MRSLARLYRVVRAQRNFRRLRVIFSSNPAPKDYDFRDPESREKCVQALRSAVAVAGAYTHACRIVWAISPYL